MEHPREVYDVGGMAKKVSVTYNVKNEVCGYFIATCEYCTFWTDTSEKLKDHVRRKHADCGLVNYKVQLRARPLAPHHHLRYPGLAGTNCSDSQVYEWLDTIGTKVNTVKSVHYVCVTVECREKGHKMNYCSLCGMEVAATDDEIGDHFFGEHVEYVVLECRSARKKIKHHFMT